MKLWMSFGAAVGVATWAYSRTYSTTTQTIAKMGLAPVIALSHGGGQHFISDSSHLAFSLTRCRTYAPLG